jgi:DMSO/TMAO reductase YedYZ heme-binding membrane subunit
MAIMLPLLLTSNVWSMTVFKKLWKPLQRLSYIAFIAAGIHVSLAERGSRSVGCGGDLVGVVCGGVVVEEEKVIM